MHVIIKNGDDAIMANFKYIGYGFIATNRKLEDVALYATSAYKALKPKMLAEIVYEAGETNSSRIELMKLYQRIVAGNPTVAEAHTRGSVKYDTVLVVPNIEALGGTIKDATAAYCFIIDAMHIVILNRPDLSTVTLNGDVLVSETESEKREMLKADFKLSKVVNKGRKGIVIDKKFRIVFWNWQNYFIDTNDALALMGCSRARLYSLAKEFMTDVAYSDLYSREFDLYMEDFENKPVRGITIEGDLKDILRQISDEYRFDWSVYNVTSIMLKNMSKAIYMSSDYIRMKLNYTYGKAAMSAATKQYSKGPEYVKQLADELSKITVELKKEDG